VASHDLILDNQTMPNFRSDANAALQALGGQQSAVADPAAMYPYERQARTDLGVVRRRNAANNAWLLDGSLAETFVIDRAANTILALADYKRTFRATASFTQTLTAVATLIDGWYCDYRVESGATIVFDPNGAENIDGAATKSVVGPSSGRIISNGAAFYTIGFTANATVNAASLTGSALAFVGMINGTIEAARAAGVETLAVKTLAGADPSAGDPVIFIFRNVTAGTGNYVFLTATAALSFAISSGSTMGATNSVPFRLWLAIFNDGGTLRLGAVNCLSGATIMALKDDDLNSSTAEGGAGGADTAQVIYTAAAVTAKAMRILGYLDYTLAAVGTWNTAPAKIQLFGPGVPLPGAVVQTARTESGASATGTTVLPFDNTIPQNTEGDQYLSQAITPRAAANLLRIQARLQIGESAGNQMSAALFQDATANALAAASATPNATTTVAQISIDHALLAAAAAATTFKIRAGGSTGPTTTFNGQGGTQIFGGVCNSFIHIDEVMA